MKGVSHILKNITFFNTLKNDVEINRLVLSVELQSTVKT